MSKSTIEVRNHTTYKIGKIERIIKNIRKVSISTYGEIKYKGDVVEIYVDSDGIWTLDVK